MPFPRLDSFIGDFGAPEEDVFILEAALRIPMDDCDRLIQLCDGLSWGRGVCLMEKRLMNVVRRYGASLLIAEGIEARFRILSDFKSRKGHSIYDQFPRRRKIHSQGAENEQVTGGRTPSVGQRTEPRTVA